MVQSQVLINEYSKHIWNLAIKYVRYYKYAEGYKEDLYQEGVIGVIKNLDHYEGLSPQLTNFKVIQDAKCGMREFLRKFFGKKHSKNDATKDRTSLMAYGQSIFNEETGEVDELLMGSEEQPDLTKKDLVEKLQNAGSRCLTGKQFESVFNGSWADTPNGRLGVRKLKDYVERNWK